MLNLASKYKN